MNNSFDVKVLETIESMMDCLTVLQDEYAELTETDYRKMLVDMLPNNYKQVAVFENGKCVGVNGYWVNTKIWCGKYLELDNIVVLKSHRSKGIGKIMFNTLEKIAEKEKCKLMTLDAYTQNFKAHKLYYNMGFEPRGFHFVKWFKK